MSVVVALAVILIDVVELVTINANKLPTVMFGEEDFRATLEHACN